MFVDLHHCSPRPSSSESVADECNDRCVLGQWNYIYANPGQEGSPLIEIDADSDISKVAFAANGEYIVCDGYDEVGVWRVDDGKEMARLAVTHIRCLAASKDGGWIAAGTYEGNVFVWDAKTFKQVFSHSEDPYLISGVDFSLDATRVVTASGNCTAPVWDVATCKKVLSLPHEATVIAAKYSPQGDRIATATYTGSVRFWDSNDGRLLVHIRAKVTPAYNAGLLWSNDHLFVVLKSTIRQIEASTGSTVSEWLVPKANDYSCIAIPNHGEFVVYSTDDTVTFWDTSTHAQLGLIKHTQPIRSIALSPDDRFLATGGEEGKITHRSLSRITVSIVSFWITASQ